VYQPPSKTSIWANGDGQVGDTTIAAAEVAVPEVAVPEDESDDEYQVISKKPKIAAEPTEVPAKIQAVPAPSEDTVKADDVERADTGEAMEVVHEAPAAEQGPVSDADWLRSRTNRVLELVADDEGPSLNAPPPTAPTPLAQIDEQHSPEIAEAEAEPQELTGEQVDDATPSEEDKIRETGRLYLRNLHFGVTEDELRDQFSKHGALEEVSQTTFPSQLTHAMMNIKIGTTDASAPEVTLENILVDVSLS
jgi:multiple RNA-binding domain-containing protein 1